MGTESPLTECVAWVPVCSSSQQGGKYLPHRTVERVKCEFVRLWGKIPDTWWMGVIIIIMVLLQLKWGHEGGPNPVWLRSFYEEEVRTQTHRGKTSGNTGRRWPATYQGERPSREPTLPTPWLWTSGLQKWETTDFHCWSRLVCGSPRKLRQRTNGCPCQRNTTLGYCAILQKTQHVSPISLTYDIVSPSLSSQISHCLIILNLK